MWGGDAEMGYPGRRNVDILKPKVAEFGTKGREVQEKMRLGLPFSQRVMKGEIPDIDFDEAVETAKAVQDLANIGTLQHDGPVWTLICDDGQTHRLIADVATLTPLVTAVFPFATPFILGAIGQCLIYIATVDQLGGHNGVEITGVIGSTGLLVVPRGLPNAFYDLLEAAKIVVSGKTVLDFIIIASAYSPQVAAALAIPTVAAVFSAVSAGTPFGWAIAAAAGILIELLEDEPDPDEHGHVEANRKQAQDWESFTMASLGGDQVSLLSHMGLLSARGGGGSAVFANRIEVGEWERWTLIQHGGGLISLRSSNGNHLVAETGGGRECNANRSQIGDWEKFRLERLPSGKVALKTLVTGDFVSVQP
jgi:hypothetical protein